MLCIHCTYNKFRLGRCIYDKTWLGRFIYNKTWLGRCIYNKTWLGRCIYNKTWLGRCIYNKTWLRCYTYNETWLGYCLNVHFIHVVLDIIKHIRIPRIPKIEVLYGCMCMWVPDIYSMLLLVEGSSTSLVTLASLTSWKLSIYIFSWL